MLNKMLWRDVCKNADAIPDTPGIYWFEIPELNTMPEFKKVNPAGHSRGDPTVPVQLLREKWVPTARILYIGGSRRIQNRQIQRVRFSAGRLVGAWGGRYLWQLDEETQSKMILCWKEAVNFKEEERYLIDKFLKEFRKLPFANIQHPRPMPEDIVDLLRELGASDKRETREKILTIPNAREQIYALPEMLSTAKLDVSELELIIRGVCRIEGWGGNHFAEIPERLTFGSTSVIPALVRMLDPTSVEREGALIDWLFSHRTNPYIPFGRQVPFGINTYNEYREYEHKRDAKREANRANQLAVEKVDKEKSHQAKEQRVKIAQAHAERSSKNGVLRKVLLKRLGDMTPAQRLQEIARSEHSAGYYPEEYANVSDDVIAELPANVRLKLWEKTKMMSGKTTWGSLSRKLKPLL